MTPEKAIQIARQIGGSVGRGRCQSDKDDLASAALLRWWREPKWDSTIGGNEEANVAQRMRWAALVELRVMQGRGQSKRTRIMLSPGCDLGESPIGALTADPSDDIDHLIESEYARSITDRLQVRLDDRLNATASALASALIADPDRQKRSIAAALGCDQRTVSRNLHKIRGALRDVLDAEAPR